MKKFYYILFLLLPLLAFVGCTDESLYDGDSESATATLSYQVSIDDDLDSRAIGDGKQVNQLKVGVFDGEILKTILTFNKNDNADWLKNITITLVKNKKYNLVFWAQKADNGFCTIDKEFNINIDYTAYDDDDDISLKATENFEAFMLVKENVSTDNPGASKITLSRPFAQVNVAASEEDILDKVKRAELTLTDLPTSFNPLKNEFGTDKVTKPFTFTNFETSEGDKLTPSGESNTYIYLATVWALPTTTDITINLYDATEGGNTVREEISFQDCQLDANTRLNMVGEMIQVEELPAWDGNFPPKESTLTIEENKYIIDDASDLAWLSKYSATLAANSTFLQTVDINMGSKTIESIQLPAGSTYDGDGKKIINYANSLFGDATKVSVKNLTVENAVVPTNGVTHVGVLMNTLSGSATFDNVIVTNSTATTTNGAAGGLVGYVVRTSKDSRSETLNVTFNNCHVVKTTVSGSVSNGHFVGLLRGYDNGETLTFNENCTLTLPSTATVSDFVSPYREGNEGAWLADNDYTQYNGWLGDEECYRGQVMYGEKRFIPCWDGKKKVTPLTDGTTKLIYSAFDLANLQGTAAGTIKLMENVDMEYDLDGASKDGVRNHIFTALSTLTKLEGNGKTIYNISIRDNYYGGFVKSESCATTFENVTFDGTDIRVTHNASTGDAYVGTLRGLAYAKTTVDNVNVKNGYLYGVNKMGGLCGAIFAELDCDDSFVYNYILENQEVLIIDPIFSISSYEIGFYPHGEIGGLIGFISANANIDNCKVEETKLKCVGVKDMSWLENSKIPGRHINQFIGDIRTTSGQKIYINNCSVKNNSYQTQTFTNNQSESKGTNFSWFYTLKKRASSSRWNIYSSCTYTKTTVNPEVELVGCCYYIFCEVYAVFGSMYKIMADTKGELWIDGVQKF